MTHSIGVWLNLWSGVHQERPPLFNFTNLALTESSRISSREGLTRPVTICDALLSFSLQTRSCDSVHGKQDMALPRSYKQLNYYTFHTQPQATKGHYIAHIMIYVYVSTGIPHCSHPRGVDILITKQIDNYRTTKAWWSTIVLKLSYVNQYLRIWNHCRDFN